MRWKMKRINNKELVNQHKGLVLFSTLLIIIGVLICMIPLLPQPDYQFFEKRIHVDRVEYDSSFFAKSSSGDFTRLFDSDGEVFIIGNQDGAYETAFTDVDLTIRYHRATEFYTRKNIVDRVTWNGGTFDTHLDQSKGHWYIALAGGIVIIFFGVLGFVLLFLIIKHNRKLQNDRNMRIRRKYGDKVRVD